MSSSWNPDEMSPDAFSEMVISQKLGGKGDDIFSKQFFDLLKKIK